MYFPFFKLHSWGKRSAVRRRRFIQRLLEGNIINLSVGNAVPGVPQVHRTCTPYAVAAFGGRNAEDGVPYGCLS